MSEYSRSISRVNSPVARPLILRCHISGEALLSSTGTLSKESRGPPFFSRKFQKKKKAKRIEYRGSGKDKKRLRGWRGQNARRESKGRSLVTKLEMGTTNATKIAFLISIQIVFSIFERGQGGLYRLGAWVFGHCNMSTDRTLDNGATKALFQFDIFRAGETWLLDTSIHIPLPIIG